jgi:type I restriction-modification system DNA methylase subunit
MYQLPNNDNKQYKLYYCCDLHWHIANKIELVKVILTIYKSKSMEQPQEYSELSRSLTKKINKTDKKNNGIYFTPPQTIRKNVEYLKPYMKNIKDVLEPSCGSCEYILTLRKEYSDINITGIEFNKTIFESIQHLQTEHSIKLFNDNYLDYESQNKFD